MSKFWSSLFLHNRFFWLFGGIITLFASGFWWAPLYVLAQLAFLVGMGICLLDIMLLYTNAQQWDVERLLPKVLSLGDSAHIELNITNQNTRNFQLTIIDELPEQLQVRDFEEQFQSTAGETQVISYTIRPTERGSYFFNRVLLYASTSIGLFERQIVKDLQHELPVYPSIIQMKQLEIRAFDRVNQLAGIKQLRRIGHSYEFDQIKNYVRGDDYRSINWKATGRRGQLMVNQYEDERAQQVYCIIDKSRGMRLPFEGLTLMDYAINTSLAISNIALRKHDRAGLLTFSDKIGSVLKADSRPAQLHQILQALYKEQERHTEANYELLYYFSRKLISGRSLLLLYTNFESMYALDRILPILRKVAAFHLLVVIFFKNTEIEDFVESPATSVEGIYQQTIARKLLAEKQAMVHKLRQYGIQAVLTRPENLSVETVNKYLELKARGLI